MKIRISATALADLNAIADWIALDDPRHALSFLAALEHQCQRLWPWPVRFPIILASKAGEIRKHVYRDHLIFFRIGAADIEVLRIVHGARDWAALFK